MLRKPTLPIAGTPPSLATGPIIGLIAATLDGCSQIVGPFGSAPGPAAARPTTLAAATAAAACSSAGLNTAWQRFKSLTMPSTSWSSASQRATTRSATSFMSAGLKALPAPSR